MPGTGQIDRLRTRLCPAALHLKELLFTTRNDQKQFKLQSRPFLDKSYRDFISHGMKSPRSLCVKNKNRPITHCEKNCAS